MPIRSVGKCVGEGGDKLAGFRIDRRFLHSNSLQCLIKPAFFNRDLGFLIERISTNLQNSFQEVAINTVASSASQSAINGDSFSDSLKAQGKNVLIYTLAKVGANEIGRAYHGTTTLDANGNVIAETPPTIDKSEQLLLHAGLGAITSSLTKNDAMSGAIAGVAGELTAELANENGAIIKKN